MVCHIIKKLRFVILTGLLTAIVCGCGEDKAEEVTTQADAVAVSVDRTQTEWEISDDGTIESAAQAGEEELEIDEATRAELTAQMLQEGELDMSIIESEEATGGCTFTLPEGFTESEDVPGMYMTKRYPIDASLISYMEVEKDISLQLMTEESFLAQMHNDFIQLYDTDIEVDLISYEKTQISGYPAFRILCSYIFEEVKITQLAYVINADKSYVITYSQTDEYDRMEEFEASAATIQVVDK
ncbi:MAG: hypothetical protein NC434_05685 [Ruminococcus sp.]|nr:hypothetical protein [Ruminococcus sp.]